jgi:parvulin-like peptidyl-prolyl isomerase
MRSGSPLLSFRRVAQPDGHLQAHFFMSRHRLTLAALIALVSAGVLLTAGCGGSTVPPDAVAIVDGQKITRAGLDELLLQAKGSFKSQGKAFPQAGTTEYQSLQQQGAVYLVRQAEFEQQAKKLGLSVTSADVDQGMVALAKQYFGGDEKKLADALKKQGTTVAQYRSIERSQLLTGKITASVTKGITVTDAEVKAYYDKNKSSSPYTTPASKTPKSRVMRHILVKTLAEANKLYAQIQAGADFAKLEQKYSLDTATNQQGGTFTATPGATVPEYDKVAFSAKTGSVSKPVHSKQYGYFLIKPVGDVKPPHTTPAVTKTFDEVKKDIKTTLLGTKKNDALTKWSTELTKTYADKIKYAVGFAPPAAATTPSTTTTTG